MDPARWQLPNVRGLRPTIRRADLIFPNGELDRSSSVIGKRICRASTAMDEAPWAAYRQRDKNAVIEKLLRRCLALALR